MAQEVASDGISMRGSKESSSGCEGDRVSETSNSASSDHFHNSMSESINSDFHIDEISQAANKRLKQTPVDSTEKVSLFFFLLTISVFLSYG